MMVDQTIQKQEITLFDVFVLRGYLLLLQMKRVLLWYF